MTARLLSFGSLFVLGSALSCLGRAREEKPPEGLQSLADQLEEARENPDGASTGAGGATPDDEPIETIVARHNVPGADGSCPIGLDSLRPWHKKYETEPAPEPCLMWRYFFADGCDNLIVVDGRLYRHRVLADGRLDWSVMNPFYKDTISGAGVDRFGNVVVLAQRGLGILNAAGQPYGGMEVPAGIPIFAHGLEHAGNFWILTESRARAEIELPFGGISWQTENFPNGDGEVDLLDSQYVDNKSYRQVLGGQLPPDGTHIIDPDFSNRFVRSTVIPQKDRTKYEIEEVTTELDNDYPLMSGQLLIDGDRTLLAVSYGTPWDSGANLPEEFPERCLSAQLLSPEDPEFGTEVDFCGYAMEMVRADDGGILTLWGVPEPGPWLTLRPILLHHDMRGRELNRWDLTDLVGLGDAGQDTLYFPKAFVMTKLSRGVAVGAFGETNDEVHLARIHVP